MEIPVGFIALTDSTDNKVRVQVIRINTYYMRGDRTLVCMGDGTMMQFKETADEIDDCISMDRLKAIKYE